MSTLNLDTMLLKTYKNTLKVLIKNPETAGCITKVKPLTGLHPVDFVEEYVPLSRIL